MKIEEDTTNKSSLLLNSNPIYKRIPVLFHNEKCFSESLVIIEYIDDTWKHNPSILPQDPAERAMARFWAKFIDEKVYIHIYHIISSDDDHLSSPVSF